MTDQNDAEIVFLGDVFLPNAVTAEIPYDHIVINLESPITDSEDGIPGKINLKATDNHLESVFGNKLSAVCLANNHICDYGEPGFSDTLEQLDKMGLVCFGAGRTLDDAMAPCLVELGGKKLALIGFVCPSTSPINATDDQPGVAPIDSHDIRMSIAEAKTLGADFVVVCFHWGAEHVPLPNGNDAKIARQTIDDGADLVIGHHAHCIQSCEIYNGKYVFFGIGNCIFPDLDSPKDYDPATKMPTDSFRMTQEYWNKTSLAVRLNVNTWNLRVDKLRFSDNCLSRITTDYSPWRFRHGIGRSYDTMFHFVFFFAKLRRIFMNFLREPKFPRLKHIRGIIELAKRRKYS